ncbi:hypothetical protein CR513_40097, partial [Mucuna pruriens]
MDCWCSSLLSLHCWEPGVFAALLSQPHAVSSCLGAKKLGPTPKFHGSTPNLERAGQLIVATAQPSEAQTLFHHINTPTWVTSKRYPTRRTKRLSHVMSWMSWLTHCSGDGGDGEHNG